MYSVDTTNLHVDLVVDGEITQQTSDVVGGKLYVPSGSHLVELTPSDARVPTTANTPYRLDRCGTASDFYVIPYEPGVAYYVDGVRRHPGNYATAGARSVTVTAQPLSGWDISGATS